MTNPLPQWTPDRGDWTHPDIGTLRSCDFGTKTQFLSLRTGKLYILPCSLTDEAVSLAESLHQRILEMAH